MRWFAAERFLYFYEALLKLDLTLDQDGPVGGGEKPHEKNMPKILVFNFQDVEVQKKNAICSFSFTLPNKEKVN